jgi:glycosyltransferase involved in cell wall biosynthesis
LPSVAVITPTVYSKYLDTAVRSVSDQTWPCQHWIINDGMTEGNEVSAYYLKLPENTGRYKNRLINGQRIYAAIPHLVNTDYILFLDEDNAFEQDHVQIMVELCESKKLDWCYSLRKIVDNDGNYVCNDDCESLGLWSAFYDPSLNFVDTNCYCIKTDVLTKVSHAINTGGWGEDRIFYKELSQKFPNFDCTGFYTVHYRNERLKQMFLDGNEVTKELYNGKYPWRN